MTIIRRVVTVVIYKSIIKNLIYILLLIASPMLLVSCANSQPKVEQGEASYKKCKDPRPQICTREYRPVCATRDTGVRCVTTPCPATELKTYGNACSACGDSKVLGYRPGACKSTSK